MCIQGMGASRGEGAPQERRRCREQGRLARFPGSRAQRRLASRVQKSRAADRCVGLKSCRAWGRSRSEQPRCHRGGNGREVVFARWRHWRTRQQLLRIPDLPCSAQVERIQVLKGQEADLVAAVQHQEVLHHLLQFARSSPGPGRSVAPSTELPSGTPPTSSPFGKLAHADGLQAVHTHEVIGVTHSWCAMKTEAVERARRPHARWAARTPRRGVPT